MNQQADDNRAWLRERIEQAGLGEKLMAAAVDVVAVMVPSALPWAQNYARAYSDGHNNRGLLGRRLDHYASAYADICEEIEAVVPGLEMTLEAFWLHWDTGAMFEGTCTEHWHFA